MLVKLLSSHFSIYGVMCGQETHKETEHEERTFCSSQILLQTSWMVQGHGCGFKAKPALQVLTDQKPIGCLINQAQKYF